MTSCASILAIFKSTLPRRERPLHRCSLFQSVYFNPRSREGSDASGNQKDRFLSISIHAPAKGATKTVVKNTSSNKFQSTLPRRERQSDEHVTRETRDFNPRSREGSDTDPAVNWGGITISIHAPAKGATHWEWTSC